MFESKKRSRGGGDGVDTSGVLPATTKAVDTIDPVDPTPDASTALDDAAGLINDLTFEIVPMKGVEGAIDALPPNSAVSVTCSPVKGLAETQRLTEAVLARGHRPIPHLSTRLVRDRTHVADLAEWCRKLALEKAFFIAGDPTDHGAYAGVTEFLSDFLAVDHGLSAIGVAAYPDGHPFLSNQALADALHTKAAMLGDAGVDGWCSTQMCFDPALILNWLGAERDRGLTLPVHLGVCGVVAKTKLVKLAVRLGIGQSLSYLRKNRSAATTMLTSTSYDPGDLLTAIAPEANRLNIIGTHAFTFNQVAATEKWRAAHVALRNSP